MAKINFYNIPENEKVDIYKQISDNIKMPAFAVEKDWWVVQSLSVIYEMEVSKHIVFKGGTSLSKAWRLIERFSEDVDLAIDRSFFNYNNELTKKQVTELRKSASSYISGPFYLELQKKFLEKGFLNLKFNLITSKDSDQDPRIIEIYYPNVIKSPGYVELKVQIEIGCRSMIEPFSMQKFSSILDEVYSNSDFSQTPISVPCVNPERTFLEKIFLLHEEFQKAPEKIRVNRLSRHLYDIEKLSHTEYAEIALKDEKLYNSVIEHRKNFTKISGIDYNNHRPEKINFIPPDNVISMWSDDYKLMQENMIYGSSLSFKDMINSLTILNNKINSLKW